MSKSQITRREAMGRVTKLVAMAAGLSATELKKLLSAQTSQENAIILQKSANNSIKTLKSLLENSITVFESQYGRSTPIQKLSVEQMLPKIGNILPKDQIQRQNYLDQLLAGRGACMVNFGAGGGTGGGALGETLCTDSNACAGQASGGCAGINACYSQTCSDTFNCGQDVCFGQEACDDSLKICRTVVGEVISVAELAQYAADPYIGLLMKRYNVTTAQALSVQINRVLSQRRLQVR